MLSRSGTSYRAGRGTWQRLLSTRSTRVYIFGLGCLALATYVWVIFFMHPARVALNLRSEHSLRHQDGRLDMAEDSTPSSYGPHRESPRQASSPPPLLLPPPEHPPPPKRIVFRPLRHHPHKDKKYRIWQLPAVDRSPRCASSSICDGDHACGPDGLGCVTDALKRKARMRDAAAWTWKGYRQYAWGHDELNAGSQNSREWFNMGLTIVDSLDTLQILKLHEEYAEARFWVANHLNFNQAEVSVFETTIRILGGLAAAFYHSGGDELFLLKAIEFADRLLPAFKTTSGFSVARFSVHDSDSQPLQLGIGGTCLAEVATVSLEFSAVTRLSGRPEFRDVAMVPWSKLLAMPDMDGLYCTFFNGDTKTCNGNHFSLGSSADSAYEYMLKQWILNRDDTVCLDMYTKAIRGMRKHMLTQLWMGEDIGDVWIAAENDNGQSRSYVLEHLTCFLPGSMALGHMYGINTANSTDEDDDLMIAVKLMKACYELYHQTATGVAFDSVNLVPQYDPPPPPPTSPPPQQPQKSESMSNVAASSLGVSGQQVNSNVAGRRLLQSEAKIRHAFVPRSRENFLRPEVAESLFYLWRATGDPIYREWGWNMFRAYEKWCRVSTGGYQVLSNVDALPPLTGNKMESFWMAETMKYFYLLFSDDPDEVPLDEFVFNTEAHPLAIWGSETDTRLLELLAKFHGHSSNTSTTDVFTKVADMSLRAAKAARRRRL